MTDSINFIEMLFLKQSISFTDLLLPILNNIIIGTNGTTIRST